MRIYIYIIIWENYGKNMVKTTGKYAKKYGTIVGETMESRWCCVFFWGPKLLNSLGSVGKYYPTSLPSGKLT